MSVSKLTIQLTRTAVTIAGRQFLPGAFGKGCPKYLKEPRKDFPHIIAAKDVGITDSTNVVDCSKAIRYPCIYYIHVLKYKPLIKKNFSYEASCFQCRM